MGRFWISLMIVLGLSMCLGCGEGKGPAWFKPGEPKVEKQQQLEEIEGTVLVAIDGRVITLEDFNARIEAFNAEIQGSEDIPDSAKVDYLIQTQEDKKRLLDGMIERELLITEAIAVGLDKDKELRQAIKALKEQLLFAKMIEVENEKVKVASQEIEDYYNLYKDAFTIPEERRVSMIVVSTESKAKELLIQLLQGMDFGTLARENSTDASVSSGGDIGYIVQQSPLLQPDKKTMFKKFEEVAFSLELNKPSTIFQGPQGYYLIKVTEVREPRERLLSEVYNTIEQGLLLRKQDEALENLINTIRKKTKIVVHDELLRD